MLSDLYELTQLKRGHQELTAKVNERAASNANEERELRDKIAQVKRQVKKEQQKRNKIQLPLEHAFWLTYFKELAILHTLLGDMHEEQLRRTMVEMGSKHAPIPVGARSLEFPRPRSPTDHW